MRTLDLSGGGEGEEDDFEEEVLDITGRLVPMTLGTILLLGIFIYLVRLGYLKYWRRRGLCSGVTSRLGVGVGTGRSARIPADGWNDLESLTSGENEETGYWGDDFIFGTITGLSEINGGRSSRRTSPSSLSSFFSIIGEAGENPVGGARSGPNDPSSDTVGVQTDRADPAMLNHFMRNHSIASLTLPNHPGFNRTPVYTISGVDRDLAPQEGQDQQPVGAEPEVIESSDADSERNSSSSNYTELYITASFQLTAPVTPLPILKPILDNISSSSGCLPVSSSSSSISISNEWRNSTDYSSDEVPSNIVSADAATIEACYYRGCL